MKNLLIMLNIQWKTHVNIIAHINNRLLFPRMYLVFLLISIISTFNFYKNSLILTSCLFVLSLVLVQMFKVSNRLYFDPIFIFLFNKNFYISYFQTLSLEIFGPSVFVLFMFSGLEIAKENGNEILLLLFIYLAFSIIVVFFSILSQRSNVVFKVFSWFLYIANGILIGIGSIILNQKSKEFLPAQDLNVFVNYKSFVFVAILLALFFWISMKTSKLAFKKSPFLSSSTFKSPF